MGIKLAQIVIAIVEHAGREARGARPGLTLEICRSSGGFLFRVVVGDNVDGRGHKCVEDG